MTKRRIDQVIFLIIYTIGSIVTYLCVSNSFWVGEFIGWTGSIAWAMTFLNDPDWKNKYK